MSHSQLPHRHGQESEDILEQIPQAEAFQSVADLLRQLSDSNRLRLFWLLCHCEECVINLSAMMGMSSPALSHHLKQLKNTGLVVSRRSGKEVYYRAVDTAAVRLLHDAFEGLMAIQCPTEE